MSLDAKRMARSPAACAAVLAAVLAGPFVGPAAGAENEYSFHRDGVLGMSFDLTVQGTSRTRAEAARQAALDEIERLEGILSVRKDDSEISRLLAARDVFKCSGDLYAVLRACDMWRMRSGGAFNPHVGELIALWKRADKTDSLPARKRLAKAVAKLKKPAWRLSHSSRTVRPLRGLDLSVNGLAKGYILDKALAAAQAKAPQAKGILLGIGGDIAAVGDAPGESGWRIGVADPLKPADNAKFLTAIRLLNRAAATSGSYARYFTIDGKRYSHILDPRTGRPADGVASATVIAVDAASADAVATALCVLGPAQGVAMVNNLAATECLIVDPAGKQYTSRRWRNMVVATSSSTGGAPSTGSESAWPKGYSFTIRLGIRRNKKRPMIAAWVADSRYKPVKMLALWGKTKYFRKMKLWYGLGGTFRATSRGVTRASPRAGAYTLTWDGTDSRGKPVKPGKYTVFIELAREKGTHATMFASISCGTKRSASARMRGNAESNGAEIRYGPARK